MDVEAEVLKRIAPNDEENKQILRIAEKIMAEVINVVEPLDIDVSPILVGSVAKGTNLKDPDIDIFIMFPPSTGRNDLESMGLKIGKEVLGEWEMQYAEHPYVFGKFMGMNVEVVPCYKIEDPSQKMSAVDRTPFHTNYIIEHLNEEQKDQVRLFKKFLKGIGIYGAEAEIEGFSGYLCELLILHYGDFKGVVTQARNWNKGTMITFNGREPPEFDDCLIVIDPVDPKRNVASALSKENFAIFIHACKDYNTNPRLEFFFPNEIVPLPMSEIKKRIQERATTLLSITFEKPKILPDILYSQIRKSLRSIITLCEKSGFRLIDSNYFVNDEVMMLLEFEVFSLPLAKPHKGPPVWHRNAFDFLNKWTSSPEVFKGPYIKTGHWFVDKRRDFRNPKELIEGKLDTLSLGKQISESMNEGYKIRVGFEMLNQRYASWLTMFLDRKFRWEY
jgi:tRNA nucleotidyltransferase (CCA-adding enzyme)